MNLNYFKNNDLAPLFLAIKEKYIKTSKIVGIIKVYPKTIEEASKISKFCGLHIKPNEENIIKIKSIEKALLKTKFDTISLLEIITYLYGDLETKEKIKIQKQANKKVLLNTFIKKYVNSPIYSWLTIELANSESFYQKIMYYLLHESDLLYNVCNALLLLPQNCYENLSVFATKVTKDPHYFDLDTQKGTLFIQFLASFLNLTFQKSRNVKIQILNEAGIYIDCFSNYVITYNLKGEKYLDDFHKRNEVVLLNLDNINKLKKVYSENKKVILLENPSLLSIIVKRKTNSAYIITSGNPNIAFYALINKLENHQLYYNGDFDPEGLLIADKLKEKYSNLNLLSYTKENFYLTVLDNKIISTSRIHKLDKIKSKELDSIKNEIIKTRKVGYQEKLIDVLIEEFNKIDC